MFTDSAFVVEQDPFMVRIGDTYRLSIPVADLFGNPAILDGAILDFGYGVRPDPSDRENAALPSAQPDVGSAALNGAVFPTLEVLMPPTETSRLVDGVSYYWAARTTISGVIETVASGTFTAVSVPL